MTIKYKTALLKISGEALKGEKNIFDKECLEKVAKQIIEVVNEGIGVGIVIGGGNIWRGKIGSEMDIPQIDADYIGMMATVINALVLESTINRLGYSKVLVYSSVEIRSISMHYEYKQARKKMDEGYILIFAGGTGYSYFTTDTCAVIRAIEIGADALLMAKNGVSGVYDSDPKINPQAKLFKDLTYNEITKRNLRVMDLTAITLAKEAKIRIEVFDLTVDNSIVKVLNGENIESTLIS